MTYRLLAFAMLILGGCDFGFGSNQGTHERTSSLAVASDGGTGTGTSVVDANGCTFVPCDGPYGTNCGVICPQQ